MKRKKILFLFLTVTIISFAASAIAADPVCTLGWSNTAAVIPTPNLRGGGGVYNGKLYLVGGYDNNTVTILDTVYIYDPAADSWTTGATMPTATLDFGSALVNGKIYVVGGSDGSSTNVVHEYDIDGDSWTTLPFTYPLTSPGITCAGAGDGKVYCFGGSTGPSNTAASYDPSVGGAWTVLATMPDIKMYAAAREVDGIIYIAGGWYAKTDDATFAYNIADDSYTTVDTLLNGRQRPAMIYAGGLLWLTAGGSFWTPQTANDEYFVDYTTWTSTGTTIGVPVCGGQPGYIEGYGIYLAGGRLGSKGADTDNNQLWQICVPVFGDITPADGPAGQAVTITGDLFEASVDVALMDDTKAVYPLDNVTVVGGDEITAEIPATMADGMYDLIFEGSLLQTTIVEDAFEVITVDDDTIDDDTIDDDVVDDDVVDDDVADDDVADDDVADDDVADDDAADDDAADDDDDDDSSCCGC